MADEIINRVANSKIITIDLSDYIPKNDIVELDLKQFLFKGSVLKEKEFRSQLREYEVSKFQNNITALFCSSDSIVPMWAYMLACSKLNDVASEIYSGNKSDVFQRLFLLNIENINISKFKNKKVIIKGCGQTPLKEELYITITKKLQKTVSSLMFGEACSAVPVYKNKK